MGGRVVAATLAWLVLAPAAANAQFTDPPSMCPRHANLGGAQAGWTHHKTWGVNSGLRIYSVRWSAYTEECQGRTREIFHLYWDLSAFPSNRYVDYQFQSEDNQGHWKPACVIPYGSDQPRCVFRLEGGTKGPRFGASPIVDYRRTKGKSRLTHVKLLASPFQEDTGTAPAGTQYHPVLKLHHSRR